MADKTPAECFQELKEPILAVKDDELATMNLTYPEATQEGYRVAGLVEKYGDQLINSDIDPVYLQTIQLRAGAFAYTVAAVDSYVKIQESNYELYQDTKAKGYTVRRRLLDDYSYIFRNNKHVLEALDRIRNGSGDLDLSIDLLSASELGTENRERLEQAHADFSKVELAAKLHQDLSSLCVKLDLDPKKTNEAKLTCRKAWTCLFEAMDEIYKAGRYVFSEQPDIEELFYNDYLQKRSKMATKKDNATTTTNSDTTPVLETAS